MHLGRTRSLAVPVTMPNVKKQHLRGQQMCDCKKTKGLTTVSPSFGTNTVRPVHGLLKSRHRAVRQVQLSCIVNLSPLSINCPWVTLVDVNELRLGTPAAWCGENNLVRGCECNLIMHSLSLLHASWEECWCRASFHSLVRTCAPISNV